jgi:tetratricopeptide (TPR) repeat protein
MIPLPGLATAALSAALENHREGRLEAAEAFYRSALAAEPDRFEALYFYGLLQLQRRAHGTAAELIARAAAARPDDGEVHYNLALALKGAGRRVDAIAAYRRTVALRPRDAAAFLNLGTTLFDEGEAEAAVAAFDQALTLRPDWADAHHNRAVALMALDRLPEAIEGLRSAVAIDPRQARIHNNLGIALRQANREAEAFLAFQAATACDPRHAPAQANLSAVLRDAGRIDEAITAAEAAVEADPAFAVGHYNLGSAQLAAGAFEAAIASLERVVALAPDHVEAWNNLANARVELSAIDSAIAAYRRALALAPQDARLSANLGRALMRLPDLAGARAAFEQAITLDPDFAEAHADLGTVLLAMGDFTNGWREFEWRLENTAYADTFPVLPVDRWAGEAGNGGRLLVYAEGGIGDVVQLLPLIGRAKALGWRTVLACRAPMIPLLRGADGIDELVDQNQIDAKYDRFVAMESLPAALGLNIGDLPLASGYLRPDPARQTAWAERLDALAGGRPKVGLVWAGDPHWPLDHLRSPGLWPMLPILDAANAAGIALFAMQVGPRRSEIAAHGCEDRLIDLAPTLGDLADTVAAMAGLDLVISSCTGPLHMAAALGRATWGLIPYDSCWRWLRDRDDSPWYPTLRLFRAPSRLDWATPVAAMVARLNAGRLR